ncbi:hypothetical protein HU755_00125 [Pseudomonas sp. SWRI111]|uniref:hypothetical protein n=1 Tax=Pseudomonas sp. SWRI111 TaxID=2745507 RepID=UPI001647678D|nr:hypothetical protein [Pseudomonas sp. SWRI111]MBC3205181.1 hypothetical protein [Pseudomonas sp. SWRI111]
MTHHEVGFCYYTCHSNNVRPASEALLAPMIAGLQGDVLDPALARVVVRVAAYAGMACGDQVRLYWEGLDIEGFAYQHERVRFVSETLVGQDLVFVIKGMHVSALDGGSLQVFWTLLSVDLPAPLESERLQLSVGDVRTRLLAPHIETMVGGTLDPSRVEEGVLVTLQPYARMSAGDRILMAWRGTQSSEAFNDALTVQAFAVGGMLSFWIPARYIEAHRGDHVSVDYRVESACGAVRPSDPASVFIGPLLRGELEAPEVLEAVDDVLSVADSTDGITVEIGNAQTLEDELVYLKCDGDFFNHRDDREITRETAGQPLIFIVPHRFWREHQGTTVRIAYTVERLDDVSQNSAVRHLRVEA